MIPRRLRVKGPARKKYVLTYDGTITEEQAADVARQFDRFLTGPRRVCVVAGGVVVKEIFR